ncbi:FAD-linked oxidase [Niastella yeongjuensis]|uniref:FAD-linked oxidase n=1 Tax=Niastella yeongjuensis TaxID=354355 RepID=A0A1V9DYJ4_9BACT|nr:FAD-binding protein [Niastella yeongjuensis]OQP38834.1 FAD-linked oxidase [Niastella yeongjuensis]SEO30795.1 FAD binding domain-containing protein [Niastella yeongjuensis]
MTLPDGILALPLTDWQNGHQNFTVSLTKDASFNLRLPFDFSQQEKNYHATTKNFQWLIQHAIDNNVRLRALGNGWSFSDVAVCNGGLVDTRELRTFFSMGNSFLSRQYLATGKTAQDLVFTQCGMSILQMNKELEEENGWMRCLRASGASNGQTIAGATATGTHGAGIKAGAVHDAIVGLHLVTGPNRHVWLERASHPVASPAFTDWLGAEVFRDDDLFNAAVVSFGSFGFIHGVLLETEPIFLLEKYNSANIPFNDKLKQAINEWKFEALNEFLPFPPESPGRSLYHFEIIVNPHHFAVNDTDKGVFLRAMYKTAYRTTYDKPTLPAGKFQYGDELLGLIQTVLDNVGRKLTQKLIPPLVTKLFPLAFASNEQATGTIGEIFTNTKFRGKAASAAIAIDTANASRAIEEIVAINKNTPFAGALALRFVKGTQATLGFTKFEKTCVLEMDGVESATSRKFFSSVWDRFEAIGLPYTLHWGKINFNLTEARIRQMYGDAAVNKWLTARHKLLDDVTQKVFTNAFMERTGLSS